MPKKIPVQPCILVAALLFVAFFVGWRWYKYFRHQPRLVRLECRVAGDSGVSKSYTFDERDGSLYKYDGFYRAYVRYTQEGKRKVSSSLGDGILTVSFTGYQHNESFHVSVLEEYNLATLRGRYDLGFNIEPPSRIPQGDEFYECKKTDLKGYAVKTIQAK